MEHGCGGLAIDASRIEIDAPIVTSRSVSFGDTGAALGGGDGKYTVSENTQGRWPANVILDEEAGAVLDAQSGPKMHSAGKARDGSAARVDDSYDATAFQLPPNRNMRRLGDTGGASRFFYCAKASRAEREAGLEHFGAATVSDGRDKAIDNAYQRGKTKRKNTHPTVKPIDLIRYLARMILPPERAAPRRILVPFSGSGSEMIGCMQAGWDEVIGIEMNPEYAAIARARIEHWHAAQG
ncbi:MAG: hypothetical protein CL489_06890 [Acidobacteria bacterium]|nr:hypothetical protein [Acidobacteriota bacterium]